MSTDCTCPPPARDNLQGTTFSFDDPQAWPEPVDCTELLNELHRTFARFLALPPGGLDALVLWTVHAHAHEAAQISPLLGLLSPEKQCGKTVTLELLAALV